MLKKLSALILLVFLGQFAKAQNEFITIWKPTTAINMDEMVAAPHQVLANQIWFPGVGQNYMISWDVPLPILHFLNIKTNGLGTATIF